jgi:hypothetical protein
VGNGGAKQGHNAIAQYLVHRALEAMHGVHHVVDGGVEELLGSFGVETANQLGRVLEVGKQHCNLLALACQGVPGSQDLFGQMHWDRGNRHTRWRWCGGQRWGRGGSARPHQDSALLIDCKLFGRDDFVLEGLEMVVVQPESDLDHPIGEPPLALQQIEDLCEDLVKRHGPPSVCQERIIGSGSADRKTLRYAWSTAGSAEKKTLWRNSTHHRRVPACPGGEPSLAGGCCRSWRDAQTRRGALPGLGRCLGSFSSRARGAQRRASAAAESGSAADAVGSQLQGLVRLRMAPTSPTFISQARAFEETSPARFQHRHQH